MSAHGATAEQETAATLVAMPQLGQDFADRRLAVVVTLAVGALLVVVLVLSLMGS